MRRLITLVLVVASLAIAALAAAGTTSAYSTYGSTALSAFGPCDPFGNALANTHIAIHNYSTGANGGTNSDQYGSYSIGGMVAGQWYGLTPSKAGYHGCGEYYFQMPARNKSLLLMLY
jgi:hypothetical protein